MSKPTRLLCPWGFSRQEYWSGLPCPPPGDLPNPGITSRSPALQADSLLSKPPRKPKNTGMGSLSLLQGNFLTQELNRGLLHCWQMWSQMLSLRNRIPSPRGPGTLHQITGSLLQLLPEPVRNGEPETPQTWPHRTFQGESFKEQSAGYSKV